MASSITPPSEFTKYLAESITAAQQAEVLLKKYPDLGRSSAGPIFGSGVDPFSYLQKPSLEGQPWTVKQGISGSRAPSYAQEAASYFTAVDKSQELQDFADWYAQEVTGSRDPATLNGTQSKVLADIKAGNVGPYSAYFGGYGEWKSAETARRNASGMLSGTLGSLIPTVMGAVTGNPWLGAAVGAAQQGVASGGNLLSMLGGAAGGYAGGGIPSKVGALVDKVKGAFSNTAFVNPDALGISPADLYNPASMPVTASNPLAASLYNPTFFGGLPAAVQANLTKTLGLPANAADTLYTPSFQPAQPGQAGISTPSNNPLNVVEGKGGSLLGTVGEKLTDMAVNSAISSLLTPPADGGGGMMASPTANAWGVNPYNRSPYPELFMRQRRGISNNLLSPIGAAPYPSAAPQLIPNAMPGQNNWRYL